MSRQPSEVRIVVARPPAGATDLVAVLQRLGPQARLELVTDGATCVARALTGEVDVVVLDIALGDQCASVLEALRPDGPPVVVVSAEDDDADALEWFRRGAADCVTLTDDSAEALPVVVLEQIRRWRTVRERGAAERRIRDLEHYNENIIQNMNSALLVVDREACITSCNPAAEQILGQSADALRGQSAGGWFPMASGEGLVAATLDDGTRFRGAESTITRSDGSTVPVGVSCAPIHDPSGELLGAVATFQDLTEIRQLRRQVMQTERMASIGQLAAGVAHEINNPMGFIHANLFQMAEYLADLRRVWTAVAGLEKAVSQEGNDTLRGMADRLAALSEDVDVDYVLTDLAKAIRESQEGSERIRAIVADLRDFSHQGSEERVVADVNHCLESTVNIVWPMMKHAVVLEKDCQDLPLIRGYPMQLKQVFMNLLVNAFQAIEEKLGQSGEVGRIQLRTQLVGSEVIVTIRDSGVGISPEHLDRIFDPFFTTKRVGTGTGLGLATSFNLVERHGGTISVENRPGEGTTFRVTLPVGDVDVGA